MMQQTIKFNFLLNMEDNGKVILELTGCSRSKEFQRSYFL